MIDIADYIYSRPTLLDLRLQGIWMGDRKSLVFIYLYLLNVFMQP